MAKKFYAVKAGRTPGIYETWSDCENRLKALVGLFINPFPLSQKPRPL